MGLSSTILTVKDPEVPLVRKLEVADKQQPTEDQNVPYKSAASTPEAGKIMGSVEPFAQIGEFMISGKNIEYMCIDETGFLPEITFVFVDQIGVFNGMHFPKNDMFLSIYIKSIVDSMKPIRADYIITSIKSNAIPNANGNGTTYIIKGMLFVPTLWDNTIKAYRSLNSYDTLFQVCEETGLGFAENESSPADEMTWINPNMTRQDFIKHVTKHAYKDDDSFFTSFITSRYILNYVNVNNAIADQDDDTDTTAVVIKSFANMDNNYNTSLNETETMPMYLTNHPNFKSTSNFILEYSPISAQGEILINKGYKRRIYYYDYALDADDPSEKFLDFFVKPISTGNTQFGGGALVPDSEELQNGEVRKWTHVNYGNTHDQYIPSLLLNSHNLAEMKKIQLKAVIPNANMNIVRGSRVPVLIVIPEPEFRNKYLPRSEDPEKLIQKRYKGNVIEQWLTDFYYVDGVKYIYDPYRDIEGENFFTEVTLAKRDWRASPNLYE